MTTILSAFLFLASIAFTPNAPGGQEKVTICHIPPGNPDNAHTIVVGEPAVRAHVELHGDSVGECGGGGSGS